MYYGVTDWRSRQLDNQSPYGVTVQSVYGGKDVPIMQSTPQVTQMPNIGNQPAQNPSANLAAGMMQPQMQPTQTDSQGRGILSQLLQAYI